MTDQVKSSPPKRGRKFHLTAPEPKTRSAYATHRQLVKISHTVLEANPKETEMANLVDLVKTGCARWRLMAKEPREITKAIESALFQRRVLRRAC